MARASSTADFALLHGGGQGSWVWGGVIEALGKRGQVGHMLALDVPGCGSKRERDAAGLSLGEVVADLLADLDASGLDDLVLVGHSQAGTVLPSLVAARPGLFRRVVYVSCCAPAPGQTVAEMMGDGVRGENPEVVGWPVDRRSAPFAEFAKAMFCNDMDEVQRTVFLARLGKDAWPVACAVSHRDWPYPSHSVTPGSYVLLEQDASLPPAWQLRFAERLGVQRIVRIDAGHQVMQTRPQALADALLAEAASRD